VLKLVLPAPRLVKSVLKSAKNIAVMLITASAVLKLVVVAPKSSKE